MSSFKFLINKLKRSEWTIPFSNLFYLFAWRGTFYPVESLLITLDFHCPVGKNPSEFWSMLRVNHYRVEERKGFWIHLNHLLFALTPLTPSPQGKILRCLRSPTTLEWVFKLLCYVFVCFLVCFFKYEAIATVAGVNTKEAHDTKYSEMFNSPFHCVITSPLEIS